MKQFEAYKSEARYYYEQVDAILENLNVIEEMDNSMNNIEDGFFASTLNKAMFRSTCLENLISVSQYYYGLEVSMEQMIDLYNTIPQKEEIDNMKEIIDGLDSSCNDLKRYWKAQRNITLIFWIDITQTWKTWWNRQMHYMVMSIV